MLLPVIFTIQPQKRPVFTRFSSRGPLASKNQLLYALTMQEERHAEN